MRVGSWMLFFIVAGGGTARGDEGPALLDGPQASFKDEFVDRLVGEWSATGTIMGQPLRHQISAAWVLSHQFLELHIRDLGPARPGRAPYEAVVFLGRDNMSERYVAHWIDTFGGRASETLGFGTKNGDTLELVFEYPDGPFRTSFTWVAAKKTWRLLMREKDKTGTWSTFADELLARP
ncbi:MAG: DUF1579 family protein [Deltaproteobacteria bacterium]|nr:DUF1579 family protein [Deltaproteobacteria bacterium]